jgi:hypothetical protein
MLVGTIARRLAAAVSAEAKPENNIGRVERV